MNPAVTQSAQKNGGAPSASRTMWGRHAPVCAVQQVSSQVRAGRSIEPAPRAHDISPCYVCSGPEPHAREATQALDTSTLKTGVASSSVEKLQPLKKLIAAKASRVRTPTCKRLLRRANRQIVAKGDSGINLTMGAAR
jgi:hypothetical protein